MLDPRNWPLIFYMALAAWMLAAIFYSRGQTEQSYLALLFGFGFFVLGINMMKIQCPHCGERIAEKAKVCRHCGRDVRA